MVRRFAGLGLAIAVSACAPAGSNTAPEPIVMVDTVRLVDTVQVEVGANAAAELEARASRLQLQLFERDAQLIDAGRQLDAARQEVVRTMAKLQSQASRAEAAAGIAEAEVAVQSLRGAGGRGSGELAQSESILRSSSAEFNNENYGGALYLATQARTIARAGESRLRGGTGRSMQQGEVLFAVPVPLRSSRRSNVRSGPGLNHDVVYTLDEGAGVIGHSYTTQWVRIVDGQGREGWIFHTLVESRGRP